MEVIIGFGCVLMPAILLGGLLMLLDRSAPEGPRYPRGVPGGEGEEGVSIGSFVGIPDAGGADFGSIPDNGPAWIAALFLLIVFGLWCYRLMSWWIRAPSRARDPLESHD